MKLKYELLLSKIEGTLDKKRKDGLGNILGKDKVMSGEGTRAKLLS